MNITRPVTHGLHQDQVDKPDHRRVIGFDTQLIGIAAAVGLPVDRCGFSIEISDILEVMFEMGIGAIELVDRRQDAVLRADSLDDFEARLRTHGIERFDIEGVTHDDRHGRRRLLLERHETETARH